MKFSEFTPPDTDRFSAQQLELVRATFKQEKNPPQWIEMAELGYMTLRNTSALESIADQDLADACVAQVYQMLLVMGGGNVYFSKGDDLLRREKHKLIVKEFNGRNYKELARKHGLSSARVMQIVDEDYTLKRKSNSQKVAVC